MDVLLNLIKEQMDYEITQKKQKAANEKSMQTRENWWLTAWKTGCIKPCDQDSVKLTVITYITPYPYETILNFTFQPDLVWCFRTILQKIKH